MDYKVGDRVIVLYEDGKMRWQGIIRAIGQHTSSKQLSKSCVWSDWDGSEDGYLTYHDLSHGNYRIIKAKHSALPVWF
jgi:hypothetical protein